MNEAIPPARNDLELFPVQHGGQQYILIRDHLGLVQEGKAIALPLYQMLALLNGTNTIRDLQMAIMRQQGGVLVGTDEIQGLIAHLDESFLLDSERFREAKERIVADFVSKQVRPASHSGGAYPENPIELRKRLDEILAGRPPVPGPEGKIKALVAPHIDLAAGHKVYSAAYQILKFVTPARVVILGIGHQMVDDMFCLTGKGFDTPLGVVKSAPDLVEELRSVGGDILGDNDFFHRSEHSIEFQAVFLRHLLSEDSFTIVPILCGSLQTTLPEYSRSAYLDRAGPFLEKLKRIIDDPEHETVVVAGVDLSHIGPKFGHEMPAMHLKRQSETHDRNLLEHLSGLDAERFWEESRGVNDQYNVCGFSALACLLEVLPPCKGTLLDYQLWHEEATRSGVSFAAVVFTL